MKFKPFFLYVCLIIILPITVYSSNIINPKNSVLDSNGISWYAASLLSVEGKGWTNAISDYERLPFKAKDIVRKVVWDLSKFSSGLFVRFKADVYIKYLKPILKNFSQ